MDAHPSSAASGASSERFDPLERLLEHPAIWRGRSVAQLDAVPTGFAAFDQALPGHGWPRAGLIEILIARVGVGEVYLLLPVLAALTRRPSSRWCAWIAPPFEPYAPALAAHGIALEKLFVVRGDSPAWAFEQALVSGACDVVLGWARELRGRDIRRLQLAAEKGRTLGVLFRPRQAANESSGAMLRMVVEPAEQGAHLTLLKSRGGHRGSIDVRWASRPSTPTYGSM
jgi:cell division inhibitor SulA